MMKSRVVRGGSSSFHTLDVDPPICAIEVMEDASQVVAKETQLVRDTVAWVQSELDKERKKCTPNTRAILEVEHATVKVTAGFLVGLVLKAEKGEWPLPNGLPSTTSTINMAENTTGTPRYHQVFVTWEYAVLRSVQDAMRHDASTNETGFLVPFAKLPV